MNWCCTSKIGLDQQLLWFQKVLGKWNVALQKAVSIPNSLLLIWWFEKRQVTNSCVKDHDHNSVCWFMTPCKSNGFHGGYRSHWPGQTIYWTTSASIFMRAPPHINVYSCTLRHKQVRKVTRVCVFLFVHSRIPASFSRSAPMSYQHVVEMWRSTVTAYFFCSLHQRFIMSGNGCACACRFPSCAGSPCPAGRLCLEDTDYESLPIRESALTRFSSLVRGIIWVPGNGLSKPE